ncbi:MAG: lysophospholipid acyltransferase family protein [Candidatus Omnitrophica bacterium]|nr:lysophospholipid acyltransferase family protein [Candidatus Omnitrophota bacterium]
MYFLFLLGRFLALILPRRVGYLLAYLLGNLQFLCAKRDFVVISNNLKPVIGDDKKKLAAHVRMIFINFTYYLVDFFRFSRINPKFITRYVKIEHREIVDRLRQEGKSIIIYSAHLGNYELGAAVMGMSGYPVAGLALPHKNPRVNRFFNHQRNLCKVKIISTDEVKTCFRYLAEGGIIAIVGDRDFFGNGEKVTLLDHACKLPKGPVRFALRSRSYIVPTFMIRENRDHYRLIFEKAISPLKGDGLKTESELLDECAGILGSYIKKYPSQWYMFGEFWTD